MALLKFGHKGTWLKGHVEGSNLTDYTYVDIDKCPVVKLENEDDFLVTLPSGERIRLLNCIWLENLSEIAPPEG